MRSSDPKFFIESRKITQTKNYQLFCGMMTRTLPIEDHAQSMHISYDESDSYYDFGNIYFVWTHTAYKERCITLSGEPISRTY